MGEADFVLGDIASVEIENLAREAVDAMRDRDALDRLPDEDNAPLIGNAFDDALRRIGDGVCGREDP